MKIRVTSLLGAALVATLVMSTGALALGSSKYSVTLKGTKSSPNGTGTGSVTVYPTRRQLCYTVTAKGITLPAYGAYVRYGRAGNTGTVIAKLTAPGTSGTSSGCVKGMNKSTLKSITSDPSGYYMAVNGKNASSSQYPAGSIRGQL